MTDFETLSSVARTTVVPEKSIKLINTDTPDLELYHFGFSICSHKVRATLHELGAGWRSLELDPGKNQNYKADYVRLRLTSDAAESSPFSTGWSGGSAVAESGFDPLVVPTLVDLRENRVIADSLEICLYLARSMRDSYDLLPEDIEQDVLAELDKVDQKPHVALLYGANPHRDGRSLIFRKVFKSEHERKAAAAREEADKVKGQDARLDAAYDAKIKKELAGSSFVASTDKMVAAIKRTDQLIEEFAGTLEASGGPWVFGDRFTMADVFWGASLLRLEFLGYSWLYRSDPVRPSVAEYADRVFARPSISQMIAKWPTHPWSRPAAKWLRRPALPDLLFGLGSREGVRGDL